MNEGHKVEVRGQHLPQYTLNIWFWVPTRKCKVEKYLHETLLVSQFPRQKPMFPVTAQGQMLQAQIIHPVIQQSWLLCSSP